jgi:hypothetical protein
MEKGMEKGIVVSAGKLLSAGFDAETIAKLLDIPVSWLADT